MTENDEKQKLKVIATYKRLDYKGVVHTDVVEREIPWEGYDPERFIKTVCLSGNVADFPRPFSGYFNDLMEKHFGVTERDKIWRPYSVESEVVSGCKFVFQRASDSCQIMRWENA